MMTFLPHPNFVVSAILLDNKRLGKQRVESYQILQALADPAYGWQNHPIVNMWRGYEDALIAYYYAVCRIWITRGYNHTMPILIPKADYVNPPWLGDPELHFSHRSKLYYKNPEHYFQWAGIEQVDYVWRV